MSVAIEDLPPIGKWRRRLRSVFLHVIVPAALVGATWSYLSFVEYVQRDPAFCGTCHKTRSEYTLWSRSEHNSIVCQDCHHQTKRESLQLLVAFTLGKQPADRAQDAARHNSNVAINACAKCHLAHDKRWPTIASSAGHRIHMASGKVSCLDCHARGIHRFGATVEVCVNCHGSHELTTNGMEEVHCLACHDFLSAGGPIRPPARVCQDCHRSRGMFETVFPANAPMGGFDCWACHRPHAKKGRLVDCESCHDDTRKLGLHAVTSHDECGDCHVAHTWVATNKHCTGCHDDKVSHHANEHCQSCHGFSRQEDTVP